MRIDNKIRHAQGNLQSKDLIHVLRCREAICLLLARRKLGVLSRVSGVGVCFLHAHTFTPDQVLLDIIISYENDNRILKEKHNG